MKRKQQQRRSDAEWFRIINECRQSGLPDTSWCTLNNIPPSTFFCALKRLREKAYAIPDAVNNSDNILDLTSKQDVVRIDITEEPPVPIAVAAVDTDNRSATPYLDNSHTIEIEIGSVSVKLNNDANPTLLKQVLLCLGGGLC